MREDENIWVPWSCVRDGKTPAGHKFKELMQELLNAGFRLDVGSPDGTCRTFRTGGEFGKWFDALDEGADALAATPRSDYRQPILRILLAHGGQASRREVLQELEKMLSRRLAPFDKEMLKSGGRVRWHENAERQVRSLRMAELLQPVEETPRGVPKNQLT